MGFPVPSPAFRTKWPAQPSPALLHMSPPNIEKSNTHRNVWHGIFSSLIHKNKLPGPARHRYTQLPDFTPDDRSGPYQCNAIALPLHNHTYSSFCPMYKCNPSNASQALRTLVMAITCHRQHCFENGF